MNYLNSHRKRCSSNGHVLCCGRVLEGFFLLFSLLFSLVTHGWFLREKVYCASFRDGGQEGDHRSVGSTPIHFFELDRLWNPVQHHMSNDPLHQRLTKGKGGYRF